MHTTVTNTITTAEPPYRPFYPQVSVTLYQELGVTMTLETDLSEPQLCTVLMLALTLDTFSPTCAVTSGGGSGGGGSGGGGSGGSTHFLLKYPLEGDLVAVNAKTSQMQARCSSGLQNPSPRPRLVSSPHCECRPSSPMRTSPPPWLLPLPRCAAAASRRSRSRACSRRSRNWVPR